MKEVLHKGKKSLFPSPDPTDLLLDDSVGRIARELWWTFQECSVGVISPWLSILI
jgi:hypothetical protein